MAAIAREWRRTPARPLWLRVLAAEIRRADMSGDAHGYIAGALALVIVCGVITLYLVKGAVPDVLNYSLLAVIGFFFAKGTTPPANPPDPPASPRLVVPGSTDRAAQ